MFLRFFLPLAIIGILSCVSVVTGSPESRVVFLDVGQGNGTYIEVGRVQLLIDAGETNKTLRELGKVHSWWDRSIDVVIASHPDKDHIGMIPDILERYDVGEYWETPRQSESAFHKAIHKELQHGDTKHTAIAAPQSVRIAKDAMITVLHPSPAEADAYSDNDSSMVLLLEISGTSFLFMGDVSVEIEQVLVRRYGPTLDADVLVVGHHGSKTSTSQELLDVVTPSYGVISSGVDNRYGHPHDSVINRLKKNNVYVLRNDELGSIQFNVFNDSEFDIVVR